MTSIGFTILDYFTQSLETKSDRRRWGLSARDFHILRKIYSWEDANFSEEIDLANELELTAERIRQLKNRGLRKIAAEAKRGRVRAGKIIGIIKRYGKVEQKEDAYKVIINLWLHEMPEIPALLAIRLLAWLHFDNSQDVKETCIYYKDWKEAKRIEQKRNLVSEWRQTKKQALLNEDLLKNIIWFNKVGKWSKEQFKDKKPKRIITQKEQYQSGLFSSQKCQRDVQYESGVELSFIKKLEENSSVLYYLEQPIIFEYTKNGKDYQYTPDFAILLEDGRCFIAEVKGNFGDMVDARVHRRMEVLMDFCEEHGMGLLLTNGKHSLDYLLDYPCDPQFEKVIQEKLNERGGRTIFLYEFNKVIDHFQVKKTAFLALVLRNNWGYYPYPFKLTPRNSHLAFWKRLLLHLSKLRSTNAQ